MYALADCNNFFVSCERLFRPDLNGRPVLVLSNNDGCVIARSNETKALGIKMGDPFFRIAHLVRKENIAVFSSNYALYADISNRIRATLREFSDNIEVYSIDEAFIDLRDCRETDLAAFAREISRRCMRNVGIPVSVGISPTRTLAKIASKLCKQYPKLQGGCYMHRPQDIEKVLRKFPVEDVWGIGRRSLKKLLSVGIETAWDYRSLSENEVAFLFALPGKRTWMELRGIPCIDINQTIDAKQTISHSRSFAKEISDRETLKEQIANFASKVAEKLRSQSSLCVEMMIYAVTNRFKEDQPQSAISTLIRFPDATDSGRIIVSAACGALDSIYRKGLAFKKAGVCATRIEDSRIRQQSLFTSFDTEKEGRLMKAVDLINNLQGENTVRMAVQGGGKAVSLSEHRSPNYTTKWSDIPVVTIR